MIEIIGTDVLNLIIKEIQEQKPKYFSLMRWFNPQRVWFLVTVVMVYVRMSYVDVVDHFLQFSPIANHAGAAIPIFWFFLNKCGINELKTVKDKHGRLLQYSSKRYYQYLCSCTLHSLSITFTKFKYCVCCKKLLFSNLIFRTCQHTLYTFFAEPNHRCGVMHKNT